MIFENYIQGLLDVYKGWRGKRFIQGVLNDNRLPRQPL